MELESKETYSLPVRASMTLNCEFFEFPYLCEMLCITSKDELGCGFKNQGFPKFTPGVGCNVTVLGGVLHSLSWASALLARAIYLDS